MTIASEITRLQNDKAAMKTAIENKGVTVWNVTLDSYAACIEAIEQGGGWASIYRFKVRVENDEVDEMFATENIIQWVKTYQYVYDDDELDDVIMVEIDVNLRYD